MNKLMTTGTLGLASLVTTGLVAWQVPSAFADHGSDDRGGDDHGHHGKAFKREDDSQAVLTTVADDDDDDTGDDTGIGGQTRTRTRTRTRGDDDSRGRIVRDLTDDGPGRGHVDHFRHHTNDGTRHDTRG